MELDPATASDVLASLRRMGCVDEDERPTLTPLAGGVSSLIVRVDGRRGTLCYKRALARLRTAREWNAPVERARAEADYLRVVGDALPGTVPTLLGWDDVGLASALAFLPHETHRLWKDALRDGHVDVSFAASVGARLARIHAFSADRASLATRFAHDAQFDALRLDPYLRATGRAHPSLAPSLERLVERTARERRALVHGDVSPKNLLVGPNGPVFLDAETAWYGDPAFDLAFCTNHLLLKCAWRPAHRHAYLAAFDALRDAYLRGVAWEEPAALESRAAALLPALFLARVDGTSPVEYLTTDEERARIRRVAFPAVLDPPAVLATFRDRWAEELER